jgi:O-antigen/teichoic acid export membrane protein
VNADPTASARLTVRLATNSLVQVVGTVVASAVSFFTFVAVARGLGPEAFGNLTAATVFLYIPVVLADVGYSAAVIREISARPDRTERAMRAALPLRTLVSAVAVAAALGIGFAMPFDRQTKTAILIGSVGAFFTLMSLTVLPVLQAQLRMQWAVAGNVAGRVATLGLTLGALAVGLGFKAVVAAQVVGLGVTFVIHAVVVARTVSLRPLVDVDYWRRLSGVALVLGIGIALGQVYFRVDTVLLALIRSPEEVGIYGAAYKFLELSLLVVTAIGWSVVPPLARLLAEDRERAKRLVQRAFDVLVAAAALIVTAMLFSAEELISLTAGSAYEESATALRLLAPFVLLSFAAGLFWAVLIVVGRDRLLLGVSSTMLVLNIALNSTFIPAYGYKAAAVISVVCEVVGLVPVSIAVARTGLLPDLRYAPVVLLAAGAMVAAGAFLPGPGAVALAVGAAAFLAVLLAAPGTSRDVFFRHLWPAARGLLRGA